MPRDPSSMLFFTLIPGHCGPASRTTLVAGSMRSIRGIDVSVFGSPGGV